MLLGGAFLLLWLLIWSRPGLTVCWGSPCRSNQENGEWQVAVIELLCGGETTQSDIEREEWFPYFLNILQAPNDSFFPTYSHMFIIHIVYHNEPLPQANLGHSPPYKHEVIALSSSYNIIFPPCDSSFRLSRYYTQQLEWFESELIEKVENLISNGC